jgi:serine protease
MSIAVLGLAACGGGGGAKNQPPVAQFSVSPDRGAFPLPVTLDASASTDDSGISTYSWTFSDGSSATGVRVERTFTARGTYTATLTVTDSGGLTSTTAKTIEVLYNLAPEVSLSLSVADGVVPLAVAFDASTTKDPENRALSFSWSLGDGNTATGATVNHVFDASNDYDVTLTVKDDVNQVQATRRVTVRLPSSVRVAGKVQLAAANLIDADTNDPRQSSSANNNTCSSSQRLTVPVSLGGFVTQAATGKGSDRFANTADKFDAFRASLAKGTIVELHVDGFNAASSSNPRVAVGLLSGDCRVYLAANVDLSAYKKLTVPEDGEYYIVVEAQTGSAGYVVRLSSPIGGTSTAAGDRYGSWDSQLPRFVPNEVVLSFGNTNEAAKAASVARNRATTKAAETATVGRFMRVALPEQSVGAYAKATAVNRAAAGLSADNRSLIEAFGATYRSKELKDYVELSAAAAQLQTEFGAQFGELNFILRSTVIPSDPLFSSQKWHYDMINLSQSWERFLGVPRSTTVVAVLDTGVFLSHPDLQSNLVAGYDFLDVESSLDGDGPDANPDDPGETDLTGRSSGSHGTHVAGTVAAVTNNSVGVAGVAALGNSVKVMPLRVLGKGGSGSSFGIANAILFAAGQSVNGVQRSTKVDVINLSLGGSSSCPQFYQAAIDAARAAGIIVVASAGNGFEEGNPSNAPANCSGVVGVGALGPDEFRSFYSQVQPYVDVAAPGGNSRLAGQYPFAMITSTNMTGSQNARGATYNGSMGTSMAAPHVAGVAALMKSVWPNMKPLDFDNLLSGGQLTRPANTRTDTARSSEYGFGVIDASKAVSAAVTGASAGTVVFLAPQPSSLDFGSSVTQRQLDLVKNGSVTVTKVEAVVASRWLTIEKVGEDAAKAQYRLTVNRSGLLGGSYGVIVRATASNGVTLDVPVTVLVAAAAGDSFAVPAYVLVYDTAARRTLAQSTASLAGTTSIDFSITGVAATKGRYILVAGSDSDNDLVICEVGDLCNAWPLSPQLVGIPGDRDSLSRSLTLGFENRAVDGSPAAASMQVFEPRSPFK